MALERGFVFLLRGIFLSILLAFCCPAYADSGADWVKNGKVQFETGDFYLPEGYSWIDASSEKHQTLFGIQEQPLSLIFISIHRQPWNHQQCQEAILKLLKERPETEKFSIELSDPVDAPFPLAHSSESKITMLNQHISTANVLTGTSYYGSNENHTVILGCLGKNGPRIATDIASSFKEKLDTEETLKSSSKIIDLMGKIAKFVYLAGVLLAAGLATSVNRAKRETIHNPYDAALTSIKWVAALHIPLGLLLLIRQSGASFADYAWLFLSVLIHCLIFAAIPLYFRGSWEENHPYNAEPVTESVPEFIIPGEFTELDDE